MLVFFSGAVTFKGIKSIIIGYSRVLYIKLSIAMVILFELFFNLKFGGQDSAHPNDITLFLLFHKIPPNTGKRISNIKQ